MLFPDEIKTIICDGVMILANREFQVNEQMKSFRTLGTDKIMGLHKSKSKNRNYDQNQIMHKAMNYLYILTERNQDVMAEFTLEIIGFIQDYLRTCQIFKADVSMERVADITQAYIESGADGARELIEAVREELHGKLVVSEGAEPLDFIEDAMGGMKISGATKPSDKKE